MNSQQMLKQLLLDRLADFRQATALIVAALLGILTSCASGVTVVNIDNGFGAACAACRVTHLARRAPQ